MQSTHILHLKACIYTQCKLFAQTTFFTKRNAEVQICAKALVISLHNTMKEISEKLTGDNLGTGEAEFFLVASGGSDYPPPSVSPETQFIHTLLLRMMAH